ncbi:unnamed protein product, partial [Brassica oleracea var. botrytis]
KEQKKKQILCRVSSPNALFVVSVTSISDGPFFLTTAFVSVISTQREQQPLQTQLLQALWKTVTTIQVADKEKGVVLETTKTKKQSKLKLYVNKSVLKEFPMMAKAVANQVIKIFHGQFTFLLKTPPLFYSHCKYWSNVMLLTFYGHMISLNKVGSDAMSICVINQI